MANLQKELWADIKDYESLYQVSVFGKIRSLTKVKRKEKHIEVYPTRLLKQSIIKSGYCVVTLWKNGIKESHLVHRIIGDAFIEKPVGCNQINHINGIKTDNRIENLEWVTQSENTIHAYKIGLIPKKRHKNASV